MEATVALPAAQTMAATDRIAQLERELAERTAQLEDAERRLQELVYVASHDLNEPLRMVKSFLELLVRHSGDQLDDRSKEFVAYAVDGADRMRALIDDLLRYSRVGSGPIQLAQVDVGEVLDGVVRNLGPRFEQDATQVVVGEPLAPLVADPTQLAQLLQNLLANAAKFHPAGRGNTITVTCARDTEAGETVLAVADDGIGISATQAERVFKPFQRLHGREEYEGNGIGLAICQRIVERHGGSIAVSETPGGGATFTVRFPDEGAA
jgi:signal transduction histidine kinase